MLRALHPLGFNLPTYSLYQVHAVNYDAVPSAPFLSAPPGLDNASKAQVKLMAVTSAQHTYITSNCISAVMQSCTVSYHPL